MNARELARQREGSWSELDGIVQEATRRGLKHVSAERLDALLHLYRATSADLARLRALEADDALVQRINRLTLRAHALVYRAPRKGVPIGPFYRLELPRLFRATWRYTAASFLVTLVFAFLADRTVGAHPEVVSDLVGDAGREFSVAHRAGDFADRFQAVPSPLLSSLVTTNNIGVALKAFAFGVTFGAGTAYVLAVNGAMLGGFSGAYRKTGLSRELWMTILPHGVLEMSAIVVAGGAGFLVGASLLFPGRRKRLDALQDSAVRAAQIAAGLVPAFVVAGALEGFVTPSRVLPPGVKVAMGALAAIAFWAYLILGGRGEAGSGLADGS
jgi:uncharacterized membrane protein SpoIIM required for sporulation